MKTGWFLAITCLLWTADVRSQDADDEVFNRFGRTRVTRTVKRSEDGMPAAEQTVTESVVALKRKIVEDKQIDASGLLQVVSRTTETTFTDGGKLTIEEKPLQGRPGLELTRVVFVAREPNGNTVTTVKTLDGSGRLELSQRTTVRLNADGTKTTIVETLNRGGQLTVSQTKVEFIDPG